MGAFFYTLKCAHLIEAGMGKRSTAVTTLHCHTIEEQRDYCPVRTVWGRPRNLRDFSCVPYSKYFFAHQ
jgi:hypothetical protein